MFLRKTIYQLTIFFCVLLLTITGSAQSGAQTEIDSTSASQIQPIPVVELIQKVSETNRGLRVAQERIKPRKNLISIDSLFDLYKDQIQERKDRIEPFLDSSPSEEEVENLITKWYGYKSYLENWVSSINSYLSRNAITYEQNSKSEKIWSLTYENARDEEVPRQVLNRVKTLWDQIRELDQEIIGLNNKYLNLESELSDQIVEIDGIIEQLEEIRQSDVYSLFHLRNPAIWKKSDTSEEDSTTQRSGRDSMTENLNDVNEFIKSNENTLYLLFFLVLAITLAVLVLKRLFIKYQPEDEEGKNRISQNVVVSHTWPVIFFISLLSTWFIFKNIPLIWEDFVFVLLLLNSIIIVRPKLHKRFKSLPFVIFVFSLLSILQHYVWIPIDQMRIYWFVEAIVIGGILTYYTNPYSKVRQLPLGKLSTLILRVSMVIYAMVVIAIISNILGYTNLTNLSLLICSEGSDLTLNAYAILLVSDGIIVGLVQNYLSRKSQLSNAERKALENRLLKVIWLGALVLWLYYFLLLVDLYQPLYEALEQILSEPYKVGTVTLTLGMLLSFVAILAISFTITSSISFLMDRTKLKLGIIKMPKGIPAAISLVLRYFILAIGFVLALSVLGIELSQFNLMAGALGLGIGFGLQTVVSNFISGIILVFERPILPGDVIEVNKLLGTVNKIGVRSSRITTFDGSEVVVPNNNLISNDLINWTLSDNIRRIEILIGTSYGSDPNQVLEVLKRVASEHEATLKNPEPFAMFLEFGESSLNFRLLYWVYFDNSLGSRSDVSIGIYNEFKKLGIEIPFPQRVVHMKSDSNSDTSSPAKRDGTDLPPPFNRE